MHVCVLVIAVVLISGSTGGDDQTSNFLFWLCVIATIVCAVLQLKLLSGMLNAFDAVSVIPVYQTLFIFNLILTGGIFFEEFSDDYLNSYNIFVFAAAIVIVIIGTSPLGSPAPLCHFTIRL